jgi:hypothetical protein
MSTMWTLCISFAWTMLGASILYLILAIVTTKPWKLRRTSKAIQLSFNERMIKGTVLHRRFELTDLFQKPKQHRFTESILATE